jgi:uncharacterized protein YceH (UPF0502 family)
MSSEPTPTPAAPPSWPVLTVPERRVLGVLVEKAKTTPDAYPLSINALVTGSNQKSNRDPTLNLSDADVEDALRAVQQKGFVMRITGGRVERWRHNLYDALRVGKVELAVLAELLLRGPQTEGELRGRAARMEPIDDLDALRAVLKPLSERRLVVYLTPEGRRGTLVTHGFHAPPELEKLRAVHGARAAADEEEAARPAAPRAPAPPTVADDRVRAMESRLDGALTEIASLRTAAADLKAQLAALAEQLRGLKEALGA